MTPSTTENVNNSSQYPEDRLVVSIFSIFLYIIVKDFILYVTRVKTRPT
jgi:hypothetical protein